MIRFTIDRRAFWHSILRGVLWLQDRLWVLPEWLMQQRVKRGEPDAWGRGAAYWTGFIAYCSVPNWLFQFLFRRSRPPSGTTLVWINVTSGKTSWICG